MFAGLGRRAEGPSALKRAVADPGPPDKDEFLEPNGKYFGLSTREAPWSQEEIDEISEAAGQRPNLLEFFVKFSGEFRAESIAASYRQGALPMISWEPWASAGDGVDQPEYTLSAIAGGRHDEYVRRFAVGVRDQGWPVAIRFAHEMNGHWYPWGSGVNGNEPGDYVAAWRHVHDLFQEIGASNVIWVWSPNIIRPVPDVDLEALYPGDEYVDWVGLTGYSVSEFDAGDVFDPTMDRLRVFTDKPVILTETGAAPGPQKGPFTASVFDWISQHPDVIGFVWFERDRSSGSGADWQFRSDPESLAAMQNGLKGLQLARE